METWRNDFSFLLSDATDLKISGSLDTDIVRNGQALSNANEDDTRLREGGGWGTLKVIPVSHPLFFDST